MDKKKTIDHIMEVVYNEINNDKSTFSDKEKEDMEELIVSISDEYALEKRKNEVKDASARYTERSIDKAFEAGAEWMQRKMIDMACVWIKERWTFCSDSVITKEFVENELRDAFIPYMEGCE